MKKESLSLTILPVFEKIQPILNLPDQTMQRKFDFFEKTKTDRLFCVYAIRKDTEDTTTKTLLKIQAHL